MKKAIELCRRFCFDGEAVEAQPYGCGHINDTYRVRCERDGVSTRRYILQRINGHVFRNIPALMENVVAVTAFLRDEVLRTGGDPDRECLTLVPTTDGAAWMDDGEGGCWRAFLFIERAVTFQTAEKPEHLYYAGSAFGHFQRLLAGFPSATLHETIPNFHNTASRYRDFEAAVAADPLGRAAGAAEEIAFVRARRDETGVLAGMLDSGELPLRVTHNDTKLNNVMLDGATGRPVAVIDLDTVMPGSSLYDFGDSIRFGANPAPEDEIDLSKVYCDLELYEQYTKGFLEECGDMLTPEEIRLLSFGSRMMTLECGMRFLTDHLQGDTYFKIHREGHNLDRCRTQFKLVADMEKKAGEMDAIAFRFVSPAKADK